MELKQRSFVNGDRLNKRPAGVTPGYCDPQEGEVSSLLTGGSGTGVLRRKMPFNRTGVGNTRISMVASGWKAKAICTTTIEKHP